LGTAIGVPADVAARFRELTQELSTRQWLALGVVAVEPSAPESAVASLLEGGSDSAFVDAGLASGLLLNAGSRERPVFGQGFRAERLLSLPPGFRTLALRKLQAGGRLNELGERAGGASVRGSVAGFSLSLLSGERRALEEAIRSLHGRHDIERVGSWARRLLRELLCSPFDATWLEQTWGNLAPLLAEQVLLDALETLEPVSEVYGWLGARQLHSASAQSVLAGHALLRGERAQLELLREVAETRVGLALGVASAYLAGNLAHARQLLSAKPTQGTSQRPLDREPPNAGALAPLLGLLVASREGPDSARLAKRWLRAAQQRPALGGWPAPNVNPRIARALSTLLSNLSKPEGKRSRQDVHQLPAPTPAWELVLLGLDVQLHERSAVNRTGWAKRLHDEAERWEEAGYGWLAEQACALREMLCPNSFGDRANTPALALCDLLQPAPEWRKSLDALASFVNTAQKQEQSRAYRVAWYVDMTQGALAKPALEHFDPGNGWTRGRRVDADGLCDMIADLPPEDAAVLRAATDTPGGRRLGPEALEALVGHPRVYNGARGRLPVEVARGECRIETRDEHGHLIVLVEPAAAEAGVNVVVDSESRLRVVRVSPVMAQLIALLPAGMRVPQAHAHELYPLLGQLSCHVPVACERLSAHQHVVANATPCLRISAEFGAFCVELGVRPFGEKGRFFPGGVGRAGLLIHESGRLLSATRDLDREVELGQALLRDCPTLRDWVEVEAETQGTDPALLEPRWIVGEDALFTLLDELREAPTHVELEWQNQRPLSARGRVTLAQLRGKLRPVKGWYLATGGLSFDGTDFDLSQLIEQPFTKSGRFIRLPDGGFAEVEKRARRSLSALRNAALGPHKSGGVKLSALAFDALKVLADTGWLGAEHANAWLLRVNAVKEQTPAPPAGLEAELRPYQLEGYRFLWRSSELELGACLADDMGLGKTLQAAALLLHRKAGGTALVVAPTSVGHNWLAELARFAPGLRAQEYIGKDRARWLADEAPVDVLVTSYSILQQDIETLAGVAWNTVILDEAQFIKNPHSARAKAAFRLQAKSRVVLTGTPVENHLGDLWSIFRFLNPELLGSYKHFFHRYLRPIERDQDLERREQLKRLVHPFLLRRTKQQVLTDLPPLTVVRHDIELSHDETLRYALLRKQIHEKLRTAHGKREHKLQVLAEITRLRRFCCHPRLVFPDAGHTASKLETFLELVEELRVNGHRALVFSQYVDFLTLVRERLDEQAISYQYLDGSTPRRQRQASVAAFQRGESELFLLSLKAGGFGLNLVAADYVIQLDPWWNPAVAAQASDRAHRIGQTRPVTVYRLVTKDTIEERIEQLQIGKRALARDVLEGSEAGSKLNLDQLQDLLA
jgi:superfamily II DNA or RNA helicase